MDSKRAHSHSEAESSRGGGGGGGSSGDSSCGSPASPSRSPAPSSRSPAPSSRSPAPSSRSPAPALLPGGNAFANDGSFMEMFKKKMEEQQRKKETCGGASATEQGQTPVEKKPPPVASFVGKRRGGVFLKTGMVEKKLKNDSEAVPGKSDAWSKYMAEVKKYKAHQCGDDDKTRPLVK